MFGELNSWVSENHVRVEDIKADVKEKKAQNANTYTHGSAHREIIFKSQLREVCWFEEWDTHFRKKLEKNIYIYQNETP